MATGTDHTHQAEKDLTPAQIVAMEYEGYLHSDGLDPAWIAGWHAAINHAVHALRKVEDQGCACYTPQECERLGHNTPPGQAPTS